MAMDAKRLGGGSISTGNLCDDLRRELKRYRQLTASRYQALTRDNVEKVLVNGPFLASPKVDGELWFLVLEGGKKYLCAPNGRSIEDICLLDEVAADTGEERVVLAGELYVATKKDRPRVGMVAALLSQGKEAETGKLGFMAFDVVSGLPSADGSYRERLEDLKRLLEGGKRCQVIPTEDCEDVKSIEELYDKWVEGGKAEGLVIRDEGGAISKMKPVFTFDVVIVAFTDSSEDPSQVGGVMLALVREDGTFQLVGGTGNIGNAQQSRALHSTLMELETESDMRHASGSGALYRFVKPEVVIEVCVTDVQTDKADGTPVRNRVLAYADDQWETMRYLPGASLLHPSLVRVREDKEVNAVDLRLAQLTERCHIDDLGQEATKVDLPASEVIRREVYTKSGKGGMAVRKLVCWKTNKEEESGNFPAYVVHFTDYSPGRKTPLAREVRLAPDLETATGISEDLIQSNIKKGWEPA